jgi:LUD domain
MIFHMRITKTVQALEANGIRTVVVETGEEARARVLDMIPSGVEVYNSPSRTLELIGLAADIEHATRFQPVRARLRSLERATQQREIRRLTASPDVLVGSVQPYHCDDISWRDNISRLACKASLIPCSCESTLPSAHQTAHCASFAWALNPSNLDVYWR